MVSDLTFAKPNIRKMEVKNEGTAILKTREVQSARTFFGDTTFAVVPARRWTSADTSLLKWRVLIKQRPQRLVVAGERVDDVVGW